MRSRKAWRPFSTWEHTYSLRELIAACTDLTWLESRKALASDLLDTHLPLQTRLSNNNPSIIAPTFPTLETILIPDFTKNSNHKCRTWSNLANKGRCRTMTPCRPCPCNKYIEREPKQPLASDSLATVTAFTDSASIGKPMLSPKRPSPLSLSLIVECQPQLLPLTQFIHSSSSPQT